MKIFKIKFDSKMPTTRKVTVGKDDDFGLAIQIDNQQSQGPAKLLYAGQEVEANKDLIEGYNVFLLKAVKDSTIAIKDIDSQVTFTVDISIKKTDVVELGGTGSGGDAVWEFDGRGTYSIPNAISVGSCDGIIEVNGNSAYLGTGCQAAKIGVENGNVVLSSSNSISVSGPIKSACGLTLVGKEASVILGDNNNLTRIKSTKSIEISSGNNYATLIHGANQDGTHHARMGIVGNYGPNTVAISNLIESTAYGNRTEGGFVISGYQGNSCSGIVDVSAYGTNINFTPTNSFGVGIYNGQYCGSPQIMNVISAEKDNIYYKTNVYVGSECTAGEYGCTIVQGNGVEIKSSCGSKIEIGTAQNDICIDSKYITIKAECKSILEYCGNYIGFGSNNVDMCINGGYIGVGSSTFGIHSGRIVLGMATHDNVSTFSYDLFGNFDSNPNINFPRGTFTFEGVGTDYSKAIRTKSLAIVLSAIECALLASSPCDMTLDDSYATEAFNKLTSIFSA